MRNIPVMNSRTREIVDILFQLSLIVLVLSIKVNLKNTDLHYRNVLVRRLAVPSLRTIVIWNEDGTSRFSYSFTSNLLVTVVDWILCENHVPYGDSKFSLSQRSSLSKSRGASSPSSKQTMPSPGQLKSWHPPCVFLLLLDLLARVRESETATKHFFGILPGFFTLFQNNEINDIIGLQPNGIYEVPDQLTNLSTWNFRVYHSFSRPLYDSLSINDSLSIAPPASPKRRGPKRKWLGPNANADKCRQVRYSKKRKLLAECHPHLLLAEIALVPPEIAPTQRGSLTQHPGRNFSIDIFGYNLYGGFGVNVLIDWSTVCMGLGVFAGASISKGTVISDYPGIVITTEFRKTMQAWQFSHLRHLSYLKTLVDGIRVPNEAQGIGPFINSSAGTSKPPNAEFRLNKDQTGTIVSAICDIQENEEVLIDYQIGWTNPL